MTPPQPYQQTTNDVRVSVRPAWSPEHSDLAAARHVFVYAIRIENLGERTIQLLRRHWWIHDDAVGDSEVEGEGVVGDQPVIAPGDDHDYESFCVLQGTAGSMVGTFLFRRTDGVEFDVDIPHFPLNMDDGD